MTSFWGRIRDLFPKTALPSTQDAREYELERFSRELIRGGAKDVLSLRDPLEITFAFHLSLTDAYKNDLSGFKFNGAELASQEVIFNHETPSISFMTPYKPLYAAIGFKSFGVREGFLNAVRAKVSEFKAQQSQTPLPPTPKSPP